MVLGMISGNDYSPNVKGFGVAKNLKILQKSKPNIEADPKLILEMYCRQFKSANSSIFANAEGIFVDLKETALPKESLKVYLELQLSLSNGFKNNEIVWDELIQKKRQNSRLNSRPLVELSHLNLTKTIKGKVVFKSNDICINFRCDPILSDWI